MLGNYRLDEFGVIHQVEFTPIHYDKKYITYYEDGIRLRAGETGPNILSGFFSRAG